MAFLWSSLRVRVQQTPALRAYRLHTTAVLAAASKKIIHRFNLADIGEGITECEVVKWNVQPLSSVQSFDPLCEVQSDKASVEITSPWDGIVTELLVKEGNIAKVGEALCLIETHDDSDGSSGNDSESTETLIAAPEIPQAPPNPNGSESKPHPMDPSRLADSNLPRPRTSAGDVLAKPSVRHFAKMNNVDLLNIGSGTGKGGRIEKHDVETYISGKREETSVTEPSAQKEGSVVELGRTRLVMWKAMEKSLEIPHFGYSTSLDLTTIAKLLPSLNKRIPQAYLSSTPQDSEPKSVSPYSIVPKSTDEHNSNPLEHFDRLTLLPFLLKTLAQAMMEWPLFRSAIRTSKESEKPSLMIRPQADISIALATPTGLYSPTLTSVETQNAFAIMGKLKRLQRLGQKTPCGLGPADMPRTGGTVTVSNVGAIGKGEYASPVLVPGGGVAIVAVGRARWMDVVPEDGIGATERRLLVGVSWSADHRVVEGAELAAFVECWRSWIEHPERMIAYGR